MWERGNEKEDNMRLVWIIALSLVSPLFVISSHVIFIVVSWLTDSAKASSVALIFLAVLLYLFFMLRQCYIANATKDPEHRCWSCCLPFYPIVQCCRLMLAFAYPCCPNRVIEDERSMEPILNILNEKFDEQCQEKSYDKEDNKFNSKAFCIVYS
jgi:hypothetical protein